MNGLHIQQTQDKMAVKKIIHIQCNVCTTFSRTTCIFYIFGGIETLKVWWLDYLKARIHFLPCTRWAFSRSWPGTQTTLPFSLWSWVKRDYFNTHLCSTLNKYKTQIKQKVILQAILPQIPDNAFTLWFHNTHIIYKSIFYVFQHSTVIASQRNYWGNLSVPQS